MADNTLDYHKSLIKFKSLLNDNTLNEIDEGLFFDLLETLPSQLSMKLQLNFRDNARFNHLLFLIDYLLDFDVTDVVSIEGSNSELKHDVDLAVWIELEGKKVLDIIDFTGSRSRELIDSKHIILMDTAKEISDSFKINVRAHVKQFSESSIKTKYKFVSKFKMDQGKFSTDFNILSYYHNSGSDDYKSFINACQKVSSYVDDYILGYKHKEVSELHKKWDPPEYLLNEALKVAQNFNVESLENMIPQGMRRYKDIMLSISTLCRKFNENKNKSKLLLGPPTIKKPKDTLTEVLESLQDDVVATAILSAIKQKNDGSNLWSSLYKNGDIIFEKDPAQKSEILSDVDCLISVRISPDSENVSWYDILWGESLIGCEDYVAYLKDEEPSKKINISNAFSTDKVADMQNAVKTIKTCIEKKKKREDYLSMAVESTNCIFSKFLVMSSICEEQNLEHQKLPLANSRLVAEILSRTVLGSVVSHYHEVAKSFAYGLKAPSRKCKYHVGVCGPYKSIVISRNSGTQDSFKSAHFMTIYSSTTMNLHETSHASIHNGIVRTKMTTINRNSLDYWIRLPLILLSATSWMREMYSFDIEVSVLKLSCELFDIAIINRDPFSQAAEQVRYFVMGAMGYGCDFTKICEKFSHLTPKSETELLYPVRTMMLGLSLDVIRRSNKMFLLKGENGDISLSMPHSEYTTSCFSQIVSSFYIHKMSNKFRAFKEISEAHCLVGLNEEKQIYERRCDEEGGIISGFSLSTRKCYNISTYLETDFVQQEVDYAISMLNSGVKRFTGSIPYVIGITSKRHKIPESLWKEVFSSVNKSPIESATMRGATKTEELTKNSQSIRASSSLLEGIISRHDFIADEVNNPFSSLENVIALNEISSSPKNVTVYSLSAMIYMTGYLLLYAYRIVDKDQIGFREISVMNFLMRMGCLYIETICRTLSKNMSNVDVVNEANKLKILQEMIRKEVRIKDFPVGVTQVQVYDNSDQKRWGPNHNMNMFAAFLLPILHDRPGIYDLALNILYMMTRKMAKFPENLIKLREKRKGKSGNSDILTKAFDIMSVMDFGEMGILMELGMGQGLLHSNSSIFGATKSEHVDELLMIDPLVHSMSLVTSDDAERRIDCPDSYVQNVCFRNHNYETSVGILFNIIRGNNKSGTGPRPELNSNWFNKGEYMNPSIKEAISKIDIGQGGCFSKDLLSSLDIGASVFSTGCSYTTSLTITLCSLTLTMESWNAWSYKYCWGKDVELLGLPVIEPLITYFTGSLSNVYLKSYNLTRMDQKLFSRYILHTMIEKYDATKLGDYVRKVNTLDKSQIKITVPEFYESFYLGISSHARTPKQLSQFNSRHHLRDWKCPESFFTLNEQSTRSDCLIGNIITRMRHTPISAFSQHPFFIRFTDPSCNFKRECLKVSSESVMTKLLGLDSESRFSREALLKALSNVKTDPIRYSNMIYEKEGHTPDNILSDRLAERFMLAKSLLIRFKQFPSGSHEKIEYRKGLGYISKISHMESEISSRDFYKQLIINSNISPRLRVEMLKELNCDYSDVGSQILLDGADMSKLEVVDVMKGMWQSINKHIKTRITCISRHPASNLTECIDDILQFNLVAPGKGTHVFNVSDLAIYTSHWVSYKRNISSMEERSEEIMDYYIKNNFNASDKPCLKPRLLSIGNENRLITTSDSNIEILANEGEKKCVKVYCKNTGSMIKFARRWLSVNADYSLTGAFSKMICEDTVLMRGTYRIGTGKYLKLLGHTKLEIQTSEGVVYHTILVKETENLLDPTPKLEYKHVFLTPKTVGSLSINNILVKENKPYLHSLKLALEGKNVMVDQEYQVDDDLVEFKSLMDKDFSLTMFRDCNYICLVNPDLIIPVTPADVSTTSEQIKLGYKISLEDSMNAFVNLRKMQEMADSADDAYVTFSKTLVEKILKSNYGQHMTIDFEFTRPWGITFSSNESIDIMRGFLLCSKNRSVSDRNLGAYVNNLFKNDNRHGVYTTEIDNQINRYTESISSRSSVSSSYFSSFADSEYLSEVSEFSEPNLMSAALPRKNVLPDHVQSRKLLAYVKRSIKGELTEKNFNLFLRQYSLIELPVVISHARNLTIDIVRHFANITLPVPFSVAVALLRHTVGDLTDFENPNLDFTLPD